MSTFLRRISYTVLLALLMSGLAALPTSAVPIGETSGDRPYSASRKISPYEKPCKMKNKHKPKKRKACKGASKMRMRASKVHKVTAKQIAKYGDLVSSSGVTLREAAKGDDSPPIKWRSFTQGGITIPGVKALYNETHKGMAFFNGEDVWIKASHGHDDDGYHHCGIETQMPGFSVNNTKCDENSKYMDSGTEYIQFWDYFEIAPVCKWCFPTHYNMHVNIHESGYISFWFFDKKRAGYN